MAVREDILNFMRSLKAGKQAVKENEFKQEAVAGALENHLLQLTDYKAQQKAYEDELPVYQEQVGDWQDVTDAQRKSYEDSLTQWGNGTGPQWDQYNTQLQTYNSWTPEIQQWVPPVNVGGTIIPGYYRTVPNPVSRPAEPTTPAQPTAPTYAPQPKMTVAHPGDMPSFEFVMPDTPYASALAKSSSVSQIPSTQGNDQQNYYQAITAQQNQTPWWKR